VRELYLKGVQSIPIQPCKNQKCIKYQNINIRFDKCKYSWADCFKRLSNGWWISNEAEPPKANDENVENAGEVEKVPVRIIFVNLVVNDYIKCFYFVEGRRWEWDGAGNRSLGQNFGGIQCRTQLKGSRSRPTQDTQTWRRRWRQDQPTACAIEAAWEDNQRWGTGWKKVQSHFSRIFDLFFWPNEIETEFWKNNIQ
jgi:hypothetical protein